MRTHKGCLARCPDVVPRADLERTDPARRMRGTAGDIPVAETGRAPPIAAVDTALAALESCLFATDPSLPIAAADRRLRRGKSNADRFVHHTAANLLSPRVKTYSRTLTSRSRNTSTKHRLKLSAVQGGQQALTVSLAVAAMSIPQI